MNIYKARVIHDVVVQAETADEAVRAIEKCCEIDGMPIHIERFTRVHKLEDLPYGWNGSELAFSEKEVFMAMQHSIRWHLEPSNVGC